MHADKARGPARRAGMCTAASGMPCLLGDAAGGLGFPVWLVGDHQWISGTVDLETGGEREVVLESLGM